MGHEGLSSQRSWEAFVAFSFIKTHGRKKHTDAMGLFLGSEVTLGGSHAYP